MTKKKRETELKEYRAIELIKEHPVWTRRRVQFELRKEFGTGLRYDAYGRLRSNILAAGAIGEYRRQKLIKLGFLPSEARALSGIALSSPLMLKYIRERQAVVKVAKEVDMPKKALSAHIRFQYRTEGFFKKGKLKPFERLVVWTKQRYDMREATAVAKLGAGAIREWLPETKRKAFKMWREAGFLTFEALEFLSTKNWQKLIVSMPGWKARFERSRWVEGLRNRGWTDKQIIAELWAYYDRDITRSPWDFIRKYRPKRKKDFVIYSSAQQERAERLTKSIGKFYRGVLARRR